MNKITLLMLLIMLFIGIFIGVVLIPLIWDVTEIKTIVIPLTFMVGMFYGIIFYSIVAKAKIDAINEFEKQLKESDE